MPQLNAAFPNAMQGLFNDSRWHVLWGGRGGSKSWNIARRLIIGAAQSKRRVLCCREFQNSIEESVHELIENQIEHMGLSSIFDVQARKIICTRTGSEFIYSGLRINKMKLKGFEDVDDCWVEEAQVVSKASWNLLIPTIRKPGSQFFVSLNPELENDETYQRLVVNPPEGAWVQKVGWEDNPWWSAEMEADRLDLLRRDPDEYTNVYGGSPRVTLTGAIYAKQVQQLISDERITKVRVQPGVPVDVFCDLGKRDHTSMWFVQRYALQTRILYSYENRQEEWPHYLSEIDRWARETNAVIGHVWLPHDGFAARLGQPKALDVQTREAGFKVQRVPSLSVFNGISAARTLLGECWFDEAGTATGRNALARYKYGVDENGQFTKEPLHDDASDYADAFRYVAVGMQTPKEPVNAKALPKAKVRARGGAGWMA